MDEWLGWVNHQLSASLDMLKIAIETATDEIWDQPEHEPFWRIATHTVFYVDFYFSTFQLDNPAETYTLPPFLSHYKDPWIDDLKEGIVSKEELLKYLAYARDQLRDYFQQDIGNQLSDHSGFEWLNLTKGELLLYNMRHVMEHTAIMNQLLKKHGLPASSWKGKSEL